MLAPVRWVTPVLAMTLTLPAVRAGQEICTDELAPVCGSDGRTFINACTLRNAHNLNPHLTAWHDGKCTDDERQGQARLECGSLVSQTPVCGSDGTTYENKCALFIAQLEEDVEEEEEERLTMVSDGECPVACPSVNSIVCGSDGVVYFNDCEFKAAQTKDPSLAVRHHGVCSVDFCKYGEAAACGSNGVIYTNRCVFELAQAQIPHLRIDSSKKRCPSTQRRLEGARCSFDCPTTFLPICASNGKTYDNDCKYKEARCEDTKLTLVEVGPCVHECPRDYAPVCGSDGKTYANECIFGNAQASTRGLTIAYTGQCVFRCPQNKDHPVCASDGQTYDNACLFAVAKASDESLQIVSSGECPIPCEAKWEPLCGSDGQTYGNTCVFQRAQRLKSDLLYERDGPCRASSPEGGAVIVDDNGKVLVRPSVLEAVSLEEQTSACDNECDTTYAPVCGSDGMTYTNKCLFQATKCLTQNVEMKIVAETDCKAATLPQVVAWGRARA